MDGADAIAIEDFAVTADGHRLAARWLRPASPRAEAPAIVFLHEGLGCTGMWQDFPAQLADRTGCTALLYDRYGHGGSDPVTEPRPEDWMHREAYVVLPAILEQCNVTRPILFGHSDGATIALLYAAAFETAAVVSEAAHVIYDQVMREGPARIRTMWGSGKLRSFLEQYHGVKSASLVQEWLDFWDNRRAAPWPIDEDLANVTCPVLAVQGDEDDFADLLQLETIIDKVGGPHKRLLIEKCGHIPHQEATDRVLDETCAFLEDNGIL